jgi:hypothetical protein
MLVEHCFFFHGFTKTRAPERKNHAQDCGALIATSFAISAPCDPAMVFESRMASILPMVRAFDPLSPSRRIAAGHALLGYDLFPETGNFRFSQITPRVDIVHAS